MISEVQKQTPAMRELLKAQALLEKDGTPSTERALVHIENAIGQMPGVRPVTEAFEAAKRALAIAGWNEESCGSLDPLTYAALAMVDELSRPNSTITLKGLQGILNHYLVPLRDSKVPYRCLIDALIIAPIVTPGEKLPARRLPETYKLGGLGEMLR